MILQPLFRQFRNVAPHLDRRRSKAVARVFQALRIEVNDELGALDRALRHLVVEEGGRVGCWLPLLEDRRVKRFSGRKF